MAKRVVYLLAITRSTVNTCALLLLQVEKASASMEHQESSYIRQQREREAAAREAQAQIDGVVKQLLAFSDEQLPPVWMMNKIGSHSAQHFKNTASWSFIELVRRGRLSTLSRVIDIGSGCGRLAIPFSLLIKEGEYHGTDVFGEGIEWCQQNITPQNPKFRFHLQNVENNYYFGGDIKPSSTISLNFAQTSTIDFVFAISVFTHLVEADAERYLDEIARCLKPDGLAYLTTFIIDRSFPDFVKRTGLHTAVAEVSPGHWQAYSGQDFFAGYDFDRWRALVERAGLEISGFDPGTWAEKRGAMHYQDIFIITKR